MTTRVCLLSAVTKQFEFPANESAADALDGYGLIGMVDEELNEMDWDVTSLSGGICFCGASSGACGHAPGEAEPGKRRKPALVLVLVHDAREARHRLRPHHPRRLERVHEARGSSVRVQLSQHAPYAPCAAIRQHRQPRQYSPLYSTAALGHRLVGTSRLPRDHNRRGALLDATIDEREKMPTQDV